MRRLRNILVGTLILLPAAWAGALSSFPSAQAPRATPRLLRKLQDGSPWVRVIIGIADGTPSPRALLMHPDPAGEPARRVVRLEAQARLADSLSDRHFRPRHQYGSFSMMAGDATPEGVIALANRPDVAWVTLDGTKKPLLATTQNAQLLINSDQANGLGFTGAGQTIAVIDTGVDYTVASLGGAPFPNAKVIGGTDTADKDNDPMDCEGHGTEVAGVIAGPSGVAPDARIVAIKVFSSQNPNNSSCKTDAFDSDILAGIDYAVTNQNLFGISGINLSLGGAFGDDADHGYCDSEEIDYAAAIDSATAAGIVVVVAAGNDGTPNAIAVPACISSAVSVGAVYAENHAKTSWLDDSGDVQCTDQPAVPDSIACFSDSNTNLSLLAPGAFWGVASKGGLIDTFSGTSASAPAAAGAVALLKQARPDLTVAGLIGILRMTGRPVIDTRNNVSTPRVDTLAAVQMPSAEFGPYQGGAVPISDATGSSTATATISGFTKMVASVQAWVEIDHPDPSQLVVTLIAPDGTSAILHNRTGQTEHPINALYGKTDETAEPLGVFQGKPANGVWTLSVQDEVAGISGRIRNFAITLVPSEPEAPIIPGVSRGRPIVVPFHN